MPTMDLPAKLRLEKYPHRLMLNQQDTVHDLAAFPFDHQPDRPPYGLVMAFVFSLEEMAAVIQRVEAERLLARDGRLYLVYPKKGNKAYKTWIGRDDIFPYLHVSDETGIVEGTRLKFNSMAAFNETFTVIGLKPLT